MGAYHSTDLIYGNALTAEADVEGFRLEGDARITFPEGRLRRANRRPASEGQQVNFVFWCPEDFPTDMAVT